MASNRDEREQSSIDYVLGLMDDAQRDDFEARIAGDPTLRDEVRACSDALVAGAVGDPVDPPPHVRQALMESLEKGGAPGDEAQRWKRWPAAAGHTFLLRSDEGTWEATDIDGMEVRRLSVDEPNGRVTMMIRMAAGTRYPRHRHGGAEECYVLSGDLRRDDQVMRAGDYEWCPTESEHGEQWTEEGCLLLVTSSRDDELLSDDG